jgi:hypothetical protein
MANVNYILHLNSFFEKIPNDKRLRPVHVSLYMALFHFWNNARFTNDFFICRAEVMKQARVGSKGTYHRCINELDEWKYIKYSPSHSPSLGSTINMIEFWTSSEQVVEHYRTKNCTTSVSKKEQVVGRYINSNKHNKTYKQGYTNFDSLKVEKDKDYNEPL